MQLVHARCAIDALGISKMIGKKATIESALVDLASEDAAGNKAPARAQQ